MEEIEKLKESVSKDEMLLAFLEKVETLTLKKERTRVNSIITESQGFKRLDNEDVIFTGYRNPESVNPETTYVSINLIDIRRIMKI